MDNNIVTMGKMNKRFGLKAKSLLLIIPLLLCCFSISSTVVVKRSQKYLINESNRFMSYKLNLVSQYATGQWYHFISNNLTDNDTIRRFVIASIGDYASSAIEESEAIFARDGGGNLIFSTGELSPDPAELDGESLFNSGLYIYRIGENSFIGKTKYLTGMDWTIYIIQRKNAFDEAIQKMTHNLILFFSGTFIVIISSFILILNIIINPINQVRVAIQKNLSTRDFSHTVPVHSSDELGELSVSFNNLITSLDLSYKKMKRNAEEEAVAYKSLHIRELESLALLGRASDYKDSHTGSHIRRVSSYSRVIAKALDLDEEYIDLLYHAAPLHDIGKLGIPDSILLKEGPLDEEEWRIIKEHTVIGYNIMQNCSSKYLKAGAVIAYSHHEKYDGSGYPRGLQGSEIPQFGRIVSLADVFDALITKRPYKEAWKPERALELIRSERGRQFDPRLVDLFLARQNEIIEIFRNTVEEG